MPDKVTEKEMLEWLKHRRDYLIDLLAQANCKWAEDELGIINALRAFIIALGEWKEKIMALTLYKRHWWAYSAKDIATVNDLIMEIRDFGEEGK